MTQVTIEKTLVEELIRSKLDAIQRIIDEILVRWGENDADHFLSRAKRGDLKNAEDDAVELRQLLSDYDRWHTLLGSFS